MNSQNIFVFVRTIISKLFIFIFLSLAIAIMFSVLKDIVDGLMNSTDVMQIFLSSINTSIIALAVFELALVINKEYSVQEEDTENESSLENTIAGLRRTLPRFIGTVCVALSLEGLIMVIKYSQLDLAGNLFYPVAIVSSTALLLLSLGLFLFFTRPQQ